MVPTESFSVSLPHIFCVLHDSTQNYAGYAKLKINLDASSEKTDGFHGRTDQKVEADRNTDHSERTTIVYTFEARKLKLHKQ